MIFKTFYLSNRSHVLVDTGQPEGHVLARTGHQHVLGVELDALDGVAVVAVQDADLGAVLRVPDVDPAVGRAGNDELRVRTEAGLEGDVLRVEVAGERLERGSGEGVDQTDERAVCRHQDGLAIGTEL